MHAKQTTELRNSNDPDGNFQRFGLSTKVLNKKKALKAKKQRKFLDSFHIKTNNYGSNNTTNLNNKKYTCFGSKNKTLLPELRESLIKTIK